LKRDFKRGKRLKNVNTLLIVKNSEKEGPKRVGYPITAWRVLSL